MVPRTINQRRFVANVTHRANVCEQTDIGLRKIKEKR